MEAHLHKNKLLPWRQVSALIKNRQPSQLHRDVWVRREALTKDHRVILSQIFFQSNTQENLSITVSNNHLRIYYRKSTENIQAGSEL